MYVPPTFAPPKTVTLHFSFTSSLAYSLCSSLSFSLPLVCLQARLLFAFKLASCLAFTSKTVGYLRPSLGTCSRLQYPRSGVGAPCGRGQALPGRQYSPGARGVWCLFTDMIWACLACLSKFLITDWMLIKKGVNLRVLNWRVFRITMIYFLRCKPTRGFSLSYFLLSYISFHSINHGATFHPFCKLDAETSNS